MNLEQWVYRCVNCYQNTVETKVNELFCKQCESTYPIIDGIPVLVRRAHQFVIAQARELSRTREKLSQRQKDFYDVSASDEHAVSGRAAKAAAAISENIALMDKQCRAIWEYANKYEHSKEDSIAWATAQAGYSFDRLLPYFYQDWYGTKQFSQVTRDIQPVIEAFCDDRESLAVLGAGACGLLQTLSCNFEKSFGVDLALPSLFMAKHLIKGEHLSFCLERADWANVELFPPQKSDTDIRFMAVNVMDTPFPNESLSAVVTQYLIDIVPNSEWFMQEIYRILKPGGVWINFSNPFSWPLDATNLGPRQLSEISPILQAQGFNELMLKKTRFNMMSVEDIFSDGEKRDEKVYIFAARKTNDTKKEHRSAVRGHIQKNPNEVWNQIPKLIDSRQIALVEKKIFKTGFQEIVPGIQVMETFIPMDRKFLSIINVLLEGIEGYRTLRQLKKHMDEQDVIISNEDFLDVIHCLNTEYYLLELYG